MKKSDLNKYIADGTISVSEAMKKIDINARQILYLVDSENRLLASVSDGDIRRWILKGGNLDDEVIGAACQFPIYIDKEDENRSEEKMRAYQISSIPVVDNRQRIVDIRFSRKEYNNETCPDILSDVPIIVMAGGKGTRLYPFTKILPKPLIPIGDEPILERILNRFYRYGAREIYLTINYKKEMIKSYFADVNPPYTIYYIEEDKPMGTAGGLRLIDKTFGMPVIITNCDILIDIDYEKVMSYHKSSNNDMTIVSSLKTTPIPYGVLHTKENGVITSMEEKPELSFFVNTGMYIVNPEFLKWIPRNKVFHMTELAQMLMEKGNQVGMYPISESSFLDMGQFEEMKKMEERINSGAVK